MQLFGGKIALNDTVGLLLNTQKKKAVDLAQRLLLWAQERNIRFLLPPHEAALLGLPSLPDQEWKKAVPFAVVIGGDGTFLRAGRYVLSHQTPLYGINVGKLGFLAAGSPDEAEEDILSILAGKHRVQPRVLLEGRVLRGDRKVHEVFALNDLVINKGSFARVIFIRILVNGEPLSLLPADGVIVATPTGSTAYALSAGGPIVPPHVPCLIVAPICAHTLYARPIILGADDVVTIAPEGNFRDLVFSQDGQLSYELLPEDRIEIRLSPEKRVQSIVLPGREYFALLQQKLCWGQSQVELGDE